MKRDGCETAHLVRRTQRLQLGRCMLFSLVACTLGVPLAARGEADKSGLKANTLSLPAGPGSLEGVGEDVDLSLNMGTASYAIPVPLPKGYPSLSPALALRYNSGAGASAVGLGWSMGGEFIERMTARGLPRYRSDDSFVTAGGDELVRLPGSSTFRARYEKSFIRYTWLDEGDGTAGAWRAEYPDGRVGYFGARGDGTQISSARLTDGIAGVYRYYLVEKRDAMGHTIRYSYAQASDCLPTDDVSPTPHTCQPLLSSIAWVFAQGSPRYSAELTYEERQDRLSNCKPGFDVRQGERLASITVRVRGVQQRKLVLTYGAYESSGGLSRLAKVTTYGVEGSAKSPIELSFLYTDAQATPLVERVGSVGVDFRTGAADLVDLNGDGLPDVVDTSDTHHLIHLSTLVTSAATSTPVLAAPQESVEDGSMRLASPSVRMADLNGDGLADMFSAQTGDVLWNLGDGDWHLEEQAATGMPDPGTDSNLRFFDYDGDKKIDLLSNQGSSCAIYRSDGTGAFLAMDDGCEAPGASATFSAGVELADINGDGLQDLVEYLSTGEVAYRLYLGYGRWLDWKTMFGLPAYLPKGAVHFVDINGDSLADVVKVEGASSAAEVELYINRGGVSFFSTSVIAVPVNGTLPSSDDASIRFADMNGNGSTDIVWIENPSGTLTYLDLYPQRAGLLARVENGIGQVIAITYGSSVHHMAADGGAGAWEHLLPNPMLTVDEIEGWAVASGSHAVRRLHYSHGYYDVEEKQFRGFREVTEEIAGDGHTEAGRIVHLFEVGSSDRYRKGLELESRSYSDGRHLSDVMTTYEDCPLSGVPTSGLRLAIRHLCPVASETIIYEGRADSDSVTTRETYDYDGYGNRTRSSKLGVVARGRVACGAACEGDEFYEETTYVTPANAAGRWILHAPYRTRAYGEMGGARAESFTYYDGEPLVGLPLGTLITGLVTRVTDKVHHDSPDVIDRARHRHDAHGNVVEVVDGNGHRRRVEYDADGLQPLFEEVVFDAPGHAPYSLRQSVTYDPLWELPASSSSWQRVEAGSLTSAAHVTAYGYDDLGRLSALAKPGDTLARPTQSFEYQPGTPRSRIVTRTRSDASISAFDLESVQCFDGLGRATQTLTRMGDSAYEASGYHVYNAQSEVSLSHQPHRLEAATCATEGPAQVLKSQTYRDARKRVTSVLAPDAEIYGTPSHTRTHYLPLAVRLHDAEDMDPTGDHYDTPTTTLSDGLGRTIAIERLLTRGGNPVTMRVGYGPLGRIETLSDDADNTRTMSYDLLGRLETINDPDAGHVGYSYDAVGNAVSRTDARGVTVAKRYDEANRMVSEWDEAQPADTLVSYEYDAAPGCESCTNLAGQLARTRYPLAGVFDALEWGEDTFRFDERTRATHSTREIHGTQFTTQVAYDNADRLASVTYPDGRTITTTLDGAGRIVAVPGYVDSASYGERGQLREMLLHNRTLTTRDYDASMRLSKLEARTDAGALIVGYSYERDRVGNIESIDDALTSTTEHPTAQTSYSYDSLYRLTGAMLDAGRAARESVTLAYDRLDNIVSMTSNLHEASRAHVGSYRYDASRPHAVAQAGAREYGYDAAGNATTRAGQTLRRDHHGRIASVASEGTTIARYGYGIDRERVVKREGKSFTYYICPDFEVRNGIATTWVRVGGARVVKVQDPSLAAVMLPDMSPAREGDGVITAADAQAAVVAGTDSEPVDMLLGASAMRALVGAEGLTTYVHQDHLGSSAATTDERGRVLQRTQSYPYGEVRYQSSYLEDYSWTGQERDRAAGFSYHSARYLDTVVGRWTSADPLFLASPEACITSPAECNLYGYVGSNASNFADPSGMYYEGRDGGAQYEGPANPSSATQFESRNEYLSWYDSPIESSLVQPYDLVAAGALAKGVVKLTQVGVKRAAGRLLAEDGAKRSGPKVLPRAVDLVSHASRQSARTSLQGPLGRAANRFFRGATKVSRDFKTGNLPGGGKRFEFFSPARNAGYGKNYVQEVDVMGNVAREFKQTLGPQGLIETKWILGGP